MNTFHKLYTVHIFAPIILMTLAAVLSRLYWISTSWLWRTFQALSYTSLAFSGISLMIGTSGLLWPGVVTATPLTLTIALLVQLLGTVMGSFSARYLQGEAGQRRYVSALAVVLSSVHLLLIADHWLILILAWASVGVALEYLLCFYPDRPFALLAAHKKRIADRVADVLLLSAMALVWLEIGSGSLSTLSLYITQHGQSLSFQLSAIFLVLAVALRTALLPVHGWLIQVMEAPTPVSALLHAGVVNLGGFVLIRFAPLFEHATPARVLLLTLGLATALLAGMVMLTRISIKVRLAWSTVAQMGFMMLECALGLYTLAALHLMGHSLYKAHAFLSASSVVRQTRLQALHSSSSPSVVSLFIAPVLAITFVLSVSTLISNVHWPWWWSFLLGLAWAPLLWMPSVQSDLAARCRQILIGISMIIGLTVAAIAAQALPLKIEDAPHDSLGVIALIGMAILYSFQMLLQRQPRLLSRWRQWSYAGFYLDEAYTRLALSIWPWQWTTHHSEVILHKVTRTELANAPH